MSIDTDTELADIIRYKIEDACKRYNKEVAGLTEWVDKEGLLRSIAIEVSEKLAQEILIGLNLKEK